MAKMSEKMQFCEKCGGEIRGEVCPQCLTTENERALPMISINLKRFIPNYSELTLYSMALTIALILFFYKESWALLSSLLDKEEGFLIIGYLGVGVLTLYLCIYHAFVKKRKLDIEKHLMLSFATMTNILSGLLAGMHALEQSAGVYAIFPAINILNSLMLALLMKFDKITIDSISDENVPLWQVAISTITLIIVFLIFKAYLNRQWYLTFSACVFYATNVNRPVILYIGNLGRRKRLMTTAWTKPRQRGRRADHA